MKKIRWTYYYPEDSRWWWETEYGRSGKYNYLYGKVENIFRTADSIPDLSEIEIPERVNNSSIEVLFEEIDE